MQTIVRDRAVQVRVSRRDRLVWRRAAAAAGLTLSELIRDAVRARVTHHETARGAAVETAGAECARSAASDSTR